MQFQKELVPYIAQALRSNWNNPAFSDYRGETFTFSQVAGQIARFHIIFEEMGLKRGDRIAFCARNGSRWAIAALASLTYGAVCVPILRDFRPESVQDLVNHSEARLLIADTGIWPALDSDAMAALDGTILEHDYSLVFSRNEKLTAAVEKVSELFDAKYPGGFSADNVSYPQEKADAPALINYTSGSTGHPKGVVLSYGALWSNIQFCIDGLTFLVPGDSMVCMLPLAHMFGFTVEMLHPFVKGCHETFLTRTPAPKILLGVFAEVRPKLIVTVPLILEKIVRTRVFPELRKPLMRVLLNIPFVNKYIYKKVRAKIVDVFGGKVLEVIIGGAALSKEVESFLRRIDFPVTVGYGMTECGPLLAYSPWNERKPGTCGRLVDRMEMKVESPDPSHVPGVLKVRGQNVMKGYFHNDAATREVFDSEGWMNTGDIVLVDNDGFITIKGRDKSMILGPSGQNIYPEEIENKLNHQPMVGESLVIDSAGKLVALIYPDPDATEGKKPSEVEAMMQANIDRVNAELPAYSKLASYRLQTTEFEKTPKRSIKRYLYRS